MSEGYNIDKLICKGGGCTAKLGARALSRVLESLPKKFNENLLVGYGGFDDAAVYKLTDELAVVQTLDFFPPMVEDPYIFGQIAAANALSDIYAMGAEVKTALNIVCFPENGDLNQLREILRGGAEKVIEAGGVIAGGHSIADDGVKYGLSVTGVIHPDRVFKNGNCLVGDLLILTKPLGVGIICTAARLGAAGADALGAAIQSMVALNKTASEVFRRHETHSCTDVTGFGFLAHLREMLGDMGARVFVDKVPYFKESRELADEFYITAAGQRNRNHVSDSVDLGRTDFAVSEILFDPQTSGGLLAAVARADAENALQALKTQGLTCAVVGEVYEKGKIICI